MEDKYENICIRVDSDPKIGSGFILKSESNYYVITAFHCIGNNENKLLCEDIKLWGDYEENRIDFLFDKEKIYFFDDEVDLAIIQLTGKIIIDKSITEIRDISELKISPIIININKGKELNSFLVGYPEDKRLPENITLERSKIKIIDYKFDNKLGVFNKTDCFYEGGETLDEKLTGYSGSGVFYEDKDYLFLNGVFTSYKENESLGKVISPIKLIELFKYCNLENPITTDSFIKIKLKEKVDKLIKKQIRSDCTLHNLCEEFKKKIDIEIDEIEKTIISLSKNKYNNPTEKYIELFVEKLYLLTYFSKQYKLDSNISAIKINGLLAKIFISKYEDFDEMKSEFIRFINDPDIKINKMDNIYIKDIHNIDGGDFECDSCRYKSRPLYSRILPVFNKTKEKNQKFNIMGKDTNEKKIIVRCADCISIHKKEKLNEIGDELWS